MGSEMCIRDSTNESLRRIPSKVANQYKVIPVKVEEGVVEVAVSNPFETGLLGAVRFAAQGPVRFVLATREEIERAYEKFYGVGAETIDELAENQAEDEEDFELLIGDGKEFVASTDQRFDLVIVDSTDPVGPGEPLCGGPFYRACHDILNDGGVIATQNGVPFFQSGEVTQTYRHFRDIFVHSGFFASPVPMYVGGHMAFGWASDRTDLSVVNEGTIQSQLESHALETRYYNSGVHVASFALPTCVQDLLV